MMPRMRGIRWWVATSVAGVLFAAILALQAVRAINEGNGTAEATGRVMGAALIGLLVGLLVELGYAKLFKPETRPWRLPVVLAMAAAVGSCPSPGRSPASARRPPRRGWRAPARAR